MCIKMQDTNLKQCYFWDFNYHLCNRFYIAVIKGNWNKDNYSHDRCLKNGGKSCIADCVGFKLLEGRLSWQQN